LHEFKASKPGDQLLVCHVITNDELLLGRHSRKRSVLPYVYNHHLLRFAIAENGFVESMTVDVHLIGRLRTHIQALLMLQYDDVLS
jgi:hypothetical protein